MSDDRASLLRRLEQLKTDRRQYKDDIAHMNRTRFQAKPIDDETREVDALIDSIEAGINNGRNPA